MNVFVLYDSQYGNTKKIAEAIAAAFPKPHSVKVFPVEEVDHSDCCKTIDLLFVGSPTQGGRPTNGLSEFLNDIPPEELKGLKFAAFDTRMAIQDVNWFLRFVMGRVGFAAPKIAKILVAKGGKLAAPPEGFIVTGKEGPLKDNELTRAKAWASSLSDSKK